MSKGKTASTLSLGARRDKANELFARGYSNAEISREIGTTPDTVARYRKRYQESISEEARTNPTMLRDILRNTMGALGALDQVLQEAWRNYAQTSTESLKATYLNTALKALEQRHKLLQLFGVKAEYLAQVAIIQDQQKRLIEFMQTNLCVDDRRRLEDFLLLEYQAEDLRRLPETPEPELPRVLS
jgi:predicted transcriptional regulator